MNQLNEINIGEFSYTNLIEIVENKESIQAHFNQRNTEKYTAIWAKFLKEIIQYLIQTNNLESLKELKRISRRIREIPYHDKCNFYKEDCQLMAWNLSPSNIKGAKEEMTKEVMDFAQFLRRTPYTLFNLKRQEEHRAKAYKYRLFSGVGFGVLASGALISEFLSYIGIASTITQTTSIVLGSAAAFALIGLMLLAINYYLIDKQYDLLQKNHEKAVSHPA